MLVSANSFPANNLCKNNTFNENTTWNLSLFFIWILMKFAQQDLFQKQEMCGGGEVKVG